MGMSSEPLRLPYARLHLTRNPFGQPPSRDEEDLAIVETEPIGSVLRAGLQDDEPVAAQYLGPPGCGKTTHLQAVLRQLQRSANIAWTPRGWPRVPAGRVLGIDDAQMMPPRRLLRTVRTRTVVVLATHVDLSGLLEAQGFRTHTIRPGTQLDQARLRRIVARRLEWARRRGSGRPPHPGDDRLAAFLARHGTNLRAIQAALYDWIQDLEEGRTRRPVEVR